MSRLFSRTSRRYFWVSLSCSSTSVQFLFALEEFGRVLDQAVEPFDPAVLDDREQGHLHVHLLALDRQHARGVQGLAACAGSPVRPSAASARRRRGRWRGRACPARRLSRRPSTCRAWLFILPVAQVGVLDVDGQRRGFDELVQAQPGFLEAAAVGAQGAVVVGRGG